MSNLLNRSGAIYRQLRAGDWLIIIFSLAITLLLFQTLWTNEHASKVQVRLGDTVYGTYSLNQNRDIVIEGGIGTSVISIAQGKVRFSKSPCHNQYCVHQGWLVRAGQAAICLPNQISLELIGENKPYDSLNY
ncbi:MAG: hypothetical protein CVU29_08725 [Betaproteobacteria bacterium HGW-Betaproteobacteria-22]|nr:MAG: hypothetical protein CVU29_08725 [Betaproteobacteria bacterium HGW-Betaproteobacteria-22]